MIGLGTIINTVAVVAGGSAGLLVKNGLPQRFKNTIMQALSLSILMIGISGTLQGIFTIIKDSKLDRQYIMTMILSLVVGAVIGELLNIEGKLDALGQFFQHRLAKNEGNFAQGFVTASLVYCVGAMAIVGSLEDGLTGDISTLLAKSMLDGISAVIFSASMGLGVAFSALPVLAYQGSVTLLAGFIKPWMTEDLISQMSLVGSILIFAIGLNMLDFIKIKVGNMLPAIFMPLAYYGITVLFKI